MKQPEKFREYIWLVETISQGRAKTLEEINALWVEEEMSGGLPLTRSTFLRHKDAIEQMFGLYIECDRRNGYRYYIGNEYVLHEDSVQNWLLSMLSVSSLVSDCLGLQSRILLERTGTDRRLLRLVVGAMRGGRRIRLDYRRYGSPEAGRHVVEPYCIKLFAQRWYLLGRLGNGRFLVFSFDRIMQAELLQERFETDPYFDAEVFFGECYGVVVGDKTPLQHIVVRAYGWERFSMIDRPLHHTQRLLAEGEDYNDFSLDLRPTSDFKAHLLSRGRWLKVLSPASLAEDIRQLHREAMEMYD